MSSQLRDQTEPRLCSVFGAPCGAALVTILPTIFNCVYNNNIFLIVFPGREPMDNIVQPNVTAVGAGTAAGGPESAQERLIKYIPLDIAGAYPLLENGIAEYVKNPFPKLPASTIIWAVFGLLLLYYVIKLHIQF